VSDLWLSLCPVFKLPTISSAHSVIARLFGYSAAQYEEKLRTAHCAQQNKLQIMTAAFRDGSEVQV
jgi:hypothetical protein